MPSVFAPTPRLAPPHLVVSYVYDSHCTTCMEMLPHVQEFAKANADLATVKTTDVSKTPGDFPSATVPAVCLTMPDGKQYIVEAAHKPSIIETPGLESWIAGRVAQWSRSKRR